MADQAQRLREILEQTQPPAGVISLRPDKLRVRTIAVTSGKGGVGKSNIVANLAIALARRGKRILIVDADLSLANIDVLLGLQPRYNLSHVLSGEKRLGEIVMEGPSGVKVIPASSGVAELAMLRESELEGLIEQFSTFLPDMDLVLIDTAAGLSDSVMSFVHAAWEVLLVTTPEPTAYMDAYQMLKNIHQYDPAKKVHLVVNMAVSDSEAEKTGSFMRQMANRFLDHEMTHLGGVLRDPDVPNAIRGQTAFVVESPHGVAARGIQGLATRLMNTLPSGEGESEDTGTLWRRLADYLKKGGR
jgi:flagellar biosynthesis protein FlhG